MINKQNIAIASTLGLIVFGISIFGASTFCKIGDGVCVDNFDAAAAALLIFVPAFIFSMLTFLINDGPFRIWAYWTLGFIPLNIALVLVTPPYTSGGGWGVAVIELRDIFVFFLPLLFSVVSVLTILVMSIYLWWKKK